MDRPVQESTVPPPCVLRAWDDMRTEVLHELQDGAEVSDTVMDGMAELAVRMDSWRAAKKPAPLGN